MKKEMNEEKGYQGWSNYETWAVKLRIDKEQGTQEYYLDMTRLFLRNPEKGISDLADKLKELIEAEAPDIEAGMYADLLNAAISEIDFFELAEALIDDVGEIEGDK
ncbi:MAG: hypothetical protein IMF19_14275 [Proteobacteria bacterium]|nr:hypothetical protein [Pseudomonadota bacterium]